MYADNPATGEIYVIQPDFLDSSGVSFPQNAPLPVDVVLRARMTVIVDEMRAELHRSRIMVGTRFYCCEGSRKCAEGEVSKITGLHLKR